MITDTFTPRSNPYVGPRAFRTGETLHGRDRDLLNLHYLLLAERVDVADVRVREVHRELAELKGTVNPLHELGQRVSRRYRLICFDEFHVADVTDAMILHRLLESLFEHRVSIVTTSNFHPDELYPHGLHRDRILPAIALLKQKLEVISVDAGNRPTLLTALGQPGIAGQPEGEQDGRRGDQPPRLSGPGPPGAGQVGLQGEQAGQAEPRHQPGVGHRAP